MQQSQLTDLYSLDWRCYIDSLLLCWLTLQHWLTSFLLIGSDWFCYIDFSFDWLRYLYVILSTSFLLDNYDSQGLVTTQTRNPLARVNPVIKHWLGWMWCRRLWRDDGISVMQDWLPSWSFPPFCYAPRAASTIVLKMPKPTALRTSWSSCPPKRQGMDCTTSSSPSVLTTGPGRSSTPSSCSWTTREFHGSRLEAAV